MQQINFYWFICDAHDSDLFSAETVELFFQILSKLHLILVLGVITHPGVITRRPLITNLVLALNI